MDFTETYDVVVAGGGVAGVAAALEAARAGCRTALVEKTVFTGGLATTGIIQIYLPLCDGRGKQVIFGIAEELLHLSLKYGPGEIPAGWGRDIAERKSRYLVTFSPASFILALDEVLDKAGVELWLDTLACRPLKDGDRVTGVMVENKSGSGLLRAGCVVDATGEADLIHRAEAPCAEEGNWLSFWGHVFSQDKLAGADPRKFHEALLCTLGGSNAGAGHPEGAPRLKGTDGRQVTQYILEGRKLLRHKLQTDWKDRKGLTRHNHFAELLPAMAQFRTTRRILGVEFLAEGDDAVHFPSSIGLTGDWRKPGAVWEIPYGALLPQKVRGILAAGRCIAAVGDAWEVTRVIPPAALTGQAAGMAAWLALSKGVTPEQLGAGAVQAEMRKRGLPVFREEIK